MLICVMLGYANILKGILKLEFCSRFIARHIAKLHVKEACVYVLMRQDLTSI